MKPSKFKAISLKKKKKDQEDEKGKHSPISQDPLKPKKKK